MSSLIVDVCTIDEIQPHGNADRLERVRAKGWWCIASKGHYKVGDKVVYFPPDSIVPKALAVRWGVAKYCTPIPNEPEKLRIRASRFRGVASFGMVQDLDDPNWDVGVNLVDHFGVTKYEPPLKASDGDAAAPIAAFHAYTNIEHLGNFPDVFKAGEEVTITEKIHGTNCRIGLVMIPGEDGLPRWEVVAGSHAVRRKEIDANDKPSRYWWPVNANVKALLHMLKDLRGATHGVILFGEIFGAGVQDMKYGQSSLAFRVFDIAIDGQYLDSHEVTAFVKARDIEYVPVLYRGPYSLTIANQFVDGPTTICAADQIRESFKGREGIVIRPAKERFDPIMGGRAILKYISADYHDRRNENETEDH